MNYTKEQLQGMSDFEVNYALADLIGFKEIKKSGDSGLILDWHSTPPGFKVNKVDYCSSPSDIMPLAFEHGISLIKFPDGWNAFADFGLFEDLNYILEWKHSFFDESNPLRAISCCLILALQGKE